MTIETITDLTHEYMCDRLNESDTSNDGRNTTPTKRPQKRKRSEKSSYDKNKKTTGVSEATIQRQPLWTMRGT